MKNIPASQAHSYLKQMLGDALQTKDAAEGIAAFAEKRKPNWTCNIIPYRFHSFITNKKNSMAKKIVITASLTGVLATRAQCPYIPYTPKEIALEGKRAVDAGAREYRTSTLAIMMARLLMTLKHIRQIGEEVRLLCPDVIINYSTGAVGLSREERIQHIVALKPDMAALNMGSMNYGIYSRKAKSFYHDFVFQNPFSDIQFYLEK